MSGADTIHVRKCEKTSFTEWDQFREWWVILLMVKLKYPAISGRRVFFVSRLTAVQTSVFLAVKFAWIRPHTRHKSLLVSRRNNWWRTDGPTDGQTLLQSRYVATKDELWINSFSSLPPGNYQLVLEVEQSICDWLISAFPSFRFFVRVGSSVETRPLFSGRLHLQERLVLS